MKTLVLCALMFLSFSAGQFKTAQLRYERVKDAYDDKEKSLRQLYTEKGVDFSSFIFIRVFKHENELELWAKKSSGTYILLKTYPVCSASGTLGPKRKQGDNQVPEGFYHIDRFNPTSAFHLSLGLNYPNASERILSDKNDPGGDIFIHGSCVSIGCMAMTDARIKEIYIAAVEAKDKGQSKIPVNIFPFRMTAENMEKFSGKYHEIPKLVEFWKNLKTGYDYFESKKKLPAVSVDEKGNYKFR